MIAEVINAQCQSLVEAGVVPAERMDEVRGALCRAWEATVGFTLGVESVAEVWPEVTEEEADRVLDLIVEWDLAGLSCDLICSAIERLFPQGSNTVRPAERSDAYAGAVVLSDVTEGVSSLTELATRLEQTARRVLAMARAGVRLAGEQVDPCAVVVVADDEATANAFGLERSGECDTSVVT